MSQVYLVSQFPVFTAFPTPPFTQGFFTPVSSPPFNTAPELTVAWLQQLLPVILLC